MPAPVRSTVWAFNPTSVPLSRGDGGAERKAVTASTAPDRVFAEDGNMMGGEKGAVKGILNRLVMSKA